MTQVQVGKPTRDDDIRWELFPDEVPFHGNFRGLSNHLTQKLHEIAASDGVSVSYDPDASMISLDFDATVDSFTAAESVASLLDAPDKISRQYSEHFAGHCFRMVFQPASQ